MNIVKLQKKFPVLEQQELFDVIEKFRQIDIDDKGWIEKQKVVEEVSKQRGDSYDNVRQTLKQVDVDASGHVELDDFVELHAKLKETKQGPVGGSTPSTSSNLVHKGKGANAKIIVSSRSGTQHTINEEERSEFTKHINSVLAGDPDIGARLPFPTDTFQIFDECKDGLVLSKLINDSVQDTIDTRVLNWPKGNKALNTFTMTENANIVINSAKAIGCIVVNVHSEDIIDGTEHLILGLIWQIIRRGLLSKISLKYHPELYRLLEDGEELELFLRLSPEKILIRWFNYHLKQAGWERTVSNFSKDVADGENYTVLLHQLGPSVCSLDPLKTRDLLARAEQVLQNADNLQARKYLTPTALVAGNPKLNLAFVAHLFNTHPGLEPVEDAEAPVIEEFDAEGEREARVFTLWLNSLEVGTPVVDLFEDLKDGTILLEAFQKVLPGSVNQKYVNQKPSNGKDLMRFKALENTNYAVEVGKANHFSLVGIEGSDILDSNKLLTLALVWQLMRRNVIQTLSLLAKDGKMLTDADILRWANETAAKGGKASRVRSFSDSSLANGIWLLDVLNGLKPGYVDYGLVYKDGSEQGNYANAKLAISIARKLGALIWLVPEDINEVRSRLILTFVGSLMSLKL